MPLRIEIDDNRVCFEIQGEKHCLIVFDSKVVKPRKAAALVSSIACKRGQKTGVRRFIEIWIKNSFKAI